MTEYFPMIPINKSISEKLSIHYIRISNDFFLNKELDQIGEEFDMPYVFPLTKITPKRDLSFIL